MRGIFKALAVAGITGWLLVPAHGQNAVVNFKATATTPGSIPVTPAQPLPVTGTTVSGTYTPTAPTTSGAMNLTTGGTAQNLFTAAEVAHGCVITNPATATERIWVNFVTTATAAANSASIPIEIGQSVGCPGGLTTAVSWIAATSNHQISAYKF